MKKDRVELSCKAIGSPIPTIQWAYNNQTLVSSKSNLITEFMITDSMDVDNNDDDESLNQSGFPNDTIYEIVYPAPNTIEIKLHVRNYSAGLHRFDCIAFNKFKKDQRSTFVKSISEPIFPAQPNTALRTIEGSSIAINCDVIAYPMPNILWLKVCKSPFGIHLGIILNVWLNCSFH